MSNGWHRKTITLQAPAHGGTRTWEVTWRTHRWTCHNTTLVWDGTNCPVPTGWHTDHGEPMAMPVQCGNCGSQHVAPYSLREVEWSDDELKSAGEHARSAQADRDAAMAALADQVRAAVASGVSEVRAAQLAGVNRLTVRKWLGKDQ